MKRRRRHALDLLPLLDVFMVVLFVFATIQEGQLDASATAAAALEAELQQLRARQIDPDELARLRRAEATATADVAAARAELARASETQTELRAALEQLRTAAEQAAATATTSGAEALRRQEVLARLLDHFSVFEIEIDGELAGDAVVNHCCYRTEPLAGAWKTCGVMPAATAELQDWLADGGAGLADALRRTRGGNAMTIVRQNERATWRVARKLEEQLRERFPEHKIYGDGVATHSLACPR
ncbi:hypothetical protein SAMN02745121_04736 [Nannocystis exedens]|uniref:Biopolymer transport protein ExbD/TolR n=1 Tax=Nannocystis exedens TaxID=54 RepID=A0A1I2BKN3_9BACT|nr:hypothetical protein [Nannocystis exedens]PCC67921.1 hypothetical protein NAEX_00929 [Nannocystis exedens]SFE56736.1 hypothetical protein SAMN02745121_04736 [Nannocystis exedens]